MGETVSIRDFGGDDPDGGSGIAAKLDNPRDAIGILDRPADAELYTSLGNDSRRLPDEALRADLLTRGALIRGAGLADLSEIVVKRAAFNTRHYLTVVTAVGDRGASLMPNLHMFERNVVRTPPSTPDSRRVALAHLFDFSDFPRFDDVLPRILIAAMPKSASTYLSTLLGQVLGRQTLGLHNRNGPIGVAFDPLVFMRAYGRGGVLHSHLDASIRTLAMVRLLKLRPVVQTRNIFDALASYLDHMAGRIYPGSHADELTGERRRRVGILRMARHYVDLVASWSSVPADLPVLWVGYDVVRSDPAGVIRRVLDHTGLAADAARIEAVVSAAKPESLPEAERSRLRFNKGVGQRGAMFTDDEKDWVRALYAEYPDVDFSCIDPEYA